jgi:tRNA (guanine-N7-)-methyltransferase
LSGAADFAILTPPAWQVPPPVDEQTPDKPYLRPVRSFVRREGRLTEGQQRALDELLPRCNAPAAGPIDPAAAFDRTAPTVLEIGFGNGESLAQMASARPDWNYLGVEVHRPGVGHLLLLLEREDIGNVRVVCDDAQTVLGRLPDGALHGLQLFFPDPWPKKRHHKRRLVQPEWAQAIRRRLAVGGFLHMATDWEDYAEHMRTVLDAAPGFRAATPAETAARTADRPQTKFERRGRKRGHGVWDIVYIRID